MNTTLLTHSRAALYPVIEELGALACHLREAQEFASAGSLTLASASAEDALDTIDSARVLLAKVRDPLGRWSAWADGLAENGKEAAHE